MTSFTALNGASPQTSEAAVIVNGGADANKAPASEERVNGQPPAAAAPAPPTPIEPQSAVETPVTKRDAWAAPSAAERSPYQQSAGYPETESSHKRKRSESVEPRRDRHTSHEDRSPEATAQPQLEPREPYTPKPRDFRPYGDERREPGESWYSRQRREEQRDDRDDDRRDYDSNQNSASTAHGGQMEEQLGEALRRGPGAMDVHADYPQTSPDGDDRSGAMYPGSAYSSDHRRDPVLQSDPKKRKRNFSNRTKTGCLTCRKRKKKCDEQKPECSNCIRGGFVCAGYPPQRGAGWQKPDNKASAIPLESKDPSYVPPGAYGMPQQMPYNTQPPQKREPLPLYRGQPLRIDPPQGRPVLTDDDRQTASTMPSASVTSPENKLSAMSYTPANVFPTPISAVSSTRGDPVSFPTPKDYQRVPPLHDLSRTEPETPHPNQLPQIHILHATRTNSPTVHPPTATSAQVAAQLALSHSQFPPTRPRTTDKDDMLSGRYYHPFDKDLVRERELCSAACYRFNSLSDPNCGISGEERSRLFRCILRRDSDRVTPVGRLTPQAPGGEPRVLGDGVVVEAPFTCDYGYNIKIGENVVIGRGCNIIDAAEVRIEDNCHIGPNVSIYTMALPIDPKRRPGVRGSAIAKAVHIEADCWIGGGATILPGRTIGKGSTVGAGAIVTKDVPPFTIVVGNPARVLRGISS